MKRLITIVPLLLLTGCGGCVLHQYPAVPTDFTGPSGFRVSVYTTTVSEGDITHSGYGSHNFGSARSPGATGFIVHIRNDELERVQTGRVNSTFVFDDGPEGPLPCKYIRFPAPNDGSQNTCSAYFAPTNLLKEVSVGTDTYKVMPYGKYRMHLDLLLEGKSAQVDLTVQYRLQRKVTKDVLGKWN